MKRISLTVIGCLIAVGLSFLITGQLHGVRQPDTMRPLVRYAHAGIAVVWLVLAAGFYPVWFLSRSRYLRAIHLGVSLATFLMLLFYRLALEQGFVGFPCRMCINLFDGGDRRWDLGAVAINYLIWIFVCTMGIAIVLKLRQRRHK